MAAIHILVTNHVPAGSNGITVSGMAHVEPNSELLGWEVTVPWNALAATIQNAIKDAAIEQAELANYEVGILDRKILYSGPVGL